MKGYKIITTTDVNTSQDKNIAKARCSGVFSKISLGGSTPVFKEAESDNGYAQKDSSNGYTLSCSQGY